MTNPPPTSATKRWLNYPTVARLQPQLTEDHTEAEFEEALEHLLVGMDLEMSQ